MGSMYRIFPALIVLYRDITVAMEVTRSMQTKLYGFGTREMDIL